MIDCRYLKRRYSIRLSFLVCLVITCLISGEELYCQSTSTIDQLKQQVSNSKSDTTKARLYGLLAWELKFTDEENAIKYANEEILIAEKNHIDILKANGFMVKALTLVIHEKIPEGMMLYDSALVYAENANDLIFQSACYSLMAGMYGDHADYDKAIELYTKGLEIANRSGDFKSIATLSNNLAETYQTAGRNTEQTQKYFQLALQSSIKINNWPAAGMNSANLAKEYARIGEKEKAMKELSNAIDLMNRDKENLYQLATTSHIIASAYFDLKQMKEAEQYALRSTLLLDSLKRPDNVLRPLTILTSIYIYNRNIDQARFYANRLLNDGKKQNAKLYIRDAYKALSDIARMENNLRDALQFFELYKLWNDSVFEMGRERSIEMVETRSILAQKELEVQYETKKKEQENNNLKTLNENLQTEKILAIIACCLFVGLGILLYIQNQKRKKANRELEAEKRTVEKQAREKEALVHEIHHRVKNNLTMLKSLLYLQSRSLNDPQTKKIFEEAQNRIQSMALVHQSLYEKEGEGNLDFIVFIRNLFEEISNSFRHQESNVVLNIDDNNIQLSLTKAIPLGLIINELFTNSFKYAFENVETGLIDIHIEQKAQHIKIYYSDNGPGLQKEFDLQKGGFGFKLLYILSDQINATLSYNKTEKESAFLIQVPLS